MKQANADRQEEEAAVEEEEEAGMRIWSPGSQQSASLPIAVSQEEEEQQEHSLLHDYRTTI